MVTDAAAAATGGTNWMALAPLPTTATRFPVRSTVWSQRAECQDGPAKVSRPGRSGMWGRLSCPQAKITVSATSSSVTGAAVPADTAVSPRRQVPVGSS